MNSYSKLARFLKVPPEDLEALFQFKPSFKAKPRLIMLLVAAIFGPITITGALGAFIYVYHRVLFPKRELPEYYSLRPIARKAMIAGGILIWLLLPVVIYLLITLAGLFDLDAVYIYAYFAGNLLLSSLVYSVFRKWRRGIRDAMAVGNRFGSAREATEEELKPYLNPPGIYIGNGKYFYKEPGHLLSIAPTASGKTSSHIIPNLMGFSRLEASVVATDVKGELACTTGSFNRHYMKKDVFYLNPWRLHRDRLGPGHSFNPLDLLAGRKDDINLADDCQLIADLLCPEEVKKTDNSFFTDTARSILSALILHLVTSKNNEKKELHTIWKWVRSTQDEWIDLLTEMGTNNDPVNGEIVRRTAESIIRLQTTSERTWGSIEATLLQCTDFLKSPALQQAMQSGLDPMQISNGRTVVYIICDADKLDSQSTWLRLMVTVLMRAVVRRPNKRVLFLVDEMAALKYVPEFLICLTAYRSYGISFWGVVQELGQLKSLYGERWHTFISNTSVKFFFRVRDIETARIVSSMAGDTSYVMTTRSFLFIKKAESNKRPLLTPNEVITGSQHVIFTFIDQLNVAFFSLLPYFRMPWLYRNGHPLFDENPYHAETNPDNDASPFNPDEPGPDAPQISLLTPPNPFEL